MTSRISLPQLMPRTGLLILLAVVAVNFALWAALGWPIQAPNWTGIVNGVSYSPYRGFDGPADDPVVDPHKIDQDLAMLQGFTKRVRTYSSLNGQDLVPYLARAYGLHVTAGAWLDGRRERNDEEIRHLIASVRNNKNVDRVIVGNESLLRGDLTPGQLISYIRRVRAAVTVPVSTAEPWHIWLAHPELGKEVDYIAVHILPYWEGLPVDDAIKFVLQQYRAVQDAFPGKKVVLSEVGWPSNGHTRDASVPSRTNEAVFLRKFLNIAQKRHIDYYVMEAFDQPWKADLEGSVGAYWGMFDSHRHLKFPLTGPIHPVPHWAALFAIAMALALFPMIWFLGRVKAWRLEGQIFFAGLIQATATAFVWAMYAGSEIYMTTAGTIAFVAVAMALGLIVVLVLVEGFEMAELLWARRLSRLFPPVAPGAAAPGRATPKVSIHVPICNEPPDMVIETLRALNRLDYPGFEVLVIDNNTKNPELWRPVEAFCKGLGSRFRFFHLDHCEGFKAGALNFALRNADPDAEIVGVIDSDYLVERDWLKSLTPYFADTGVAFVQAPQDYRDGTLGWFKRMCFWEYAGFFSVGMVHRNERNAIIQHGTMTLIRRATLEKTGRWAEWCICEDAELGLRFFEDRQESIYVRRSYGRGLMPDSFAGYKGQRFRWAYGAIQILKRHWRPLLSPRSGLSLGQRYHFIAGWLPWLGDAFNLLFTVFALVWTVGLVAAPMRFDFPLTFALTSAIALFGFKFVKGLWLYGARVRCGPKESLGAALAGLGLSYTVGRAVIAGLLTSGRPFLRTPKCECRPALVRALVAVREEIAFLAATWAAAIAVTAAYGTTQTEAVIWVSLLLIESMPFAASVATSMISVLPAKRLEPVSATVPSAQLGETGRESQTT